MRKLHVLSLLNYGILLKKFCVFAASLDLAAASCSEMNSENSFSLAKAEVCSSLMMIVSVCVCLLMRV